MGKIIWINEKQYKWLIERNTDNSAPNFDGKAEEYNDSETTITSNVTDSNGDIKNGKPITTDDFADTQVSQNYWMQGVRGGRGI